MSRQKTKGMTPEVVHLPPWSLCGGQGKPRYLPPRWRKILEEREKLISLEKQRESISQARQSDPVLQTMKKHGIEKTRKNYMEIAFFGQDEPPDAEQLAEIPENLE